MSLLQEVIEEYCQAENSSENPRPLGAKTDKTPSGTFGTESPGHSHISKEPAELSARRPDWSESPLVQSIDQWSKRLRESPDELRRAAGDDWEEVSADIVGFADALAVNQIRESGAIPSSYASETFCRKCNSCVPFYEGVPEIGSCSWSRHGQTPQPKPEVKE